MPPPMYRFGVLASVLVALAFTLTAAPPDPKRPAGVSDVADRSAAADFRAAIPPSAAAEKNLSLFMLFADRERGEAHYLESMMAEPNQLAALAEEMKAVMLFVTPRSDKPRDVAAAATALARDYPADAGVLMAIGHGGGADAALAMFTAPQRTVTALVLASPALKSEADEPKVGKDPRPVWIVHAADKAESAEATKRRLLDRCDKTDVTMTSFPVLEKLPAAHLAAFARYAQVLDTLADLGSGATRPPEQGVQRIRGLQVLVRGRDLLKDPDLGLNQPVALRYAANTAELDRAFLADLRDKAKALVQDRDALAAQIEKTLAEARAAGERRLDVIRKSKLDEPRRKAAIERFCQENFPWPDLVQAAQAAPQGAPAAPAKPGGQTGKPAADKAKDGKTVTEADFLAIMRGRCVRCHRETGTVDGLKQKHWLVPGQPDRSAAYTVIGKHRKAGATYHNVPEQEKQAIHDFIDGLKP